MGQHAEGVPGVLAAALGEGLPDGRVRKGKEGNFLMQLINGVYGRGGGTGKRERQLSEVSHNKEQIFCVLLTSLLH